MADGDVRHGPALDRVLAHAGSALVIAADGGATKAIQLGLEPAVVVGDGDSLPTTRADKLRAAGAEVIIHRPDKDESDTELAVREAVRRGATRILIVGAMGGQRLEHAVANLLLLALPELAGVDARIVDGPSELRVIGHSGPAEAQVRGEATDFVSLLPLSDAVEGVTTNGLRFPLTDATLFQGPARGLSNELAEPSASVTTKRGRLAVIHTIRTGGNHHANS